MRGRKAVRPVLEPDALYDSRLVTRLANKTMYSGKKSIALTAVYKALEKIKEDSKQDPLTVLEKAIQNVAPKMEVRPRRVGGASYQVPVEVRGDRKEALAIRWILAGARAKSNKEFHHFYEKLAKELLDASNNAGFAVKKRDDVQKVAQANKAFSHFRF